MLAVAASMLLAASASGVTRVAVPNLHLVGMDAKLTDFLTEQLAQGLVARGLRTVTQRDMAAVIDVDRQKQMLGCSETSQSCITELANALGVDGIVIGEVVKLGNQWNVTLRALQATN